MGSSGLSRKCRSGLPLLFTYRHVRSTTRASLGTLSLSTKRVAYAELETEKEKQRLRLVFVMHEVLVRGLALRRSETTKQREELSLLAKLPKSQESLVGEGKMIVRELTVTEVNPAGEPSSKATD